MRRTGKTWKKSDRGTELWIKDERKESREGIFCDPAVLLFCFFSADTVNMVGAGSIFFFYRSHATSQWSMDAGPLQTYTVEHALCGSAKRGHLGERGSIHPHSPSHHPSSRLRSPITPLSTYFFFSTSPSFHPSHSDWKPVKDGVAAKV